MRPVRLQAALFCVALLSCLLMLPLVALAFETAGDSADAYEVDREVSLLEVEREVVPGDSDGDAIPDDQDPCPNDPANDWDGDGICAVDDICPGGDDRLDFDGDGSPDACDVCPGDAMDLCTELPPEECLYPDEAWQGLVGCGEECSGAYESAGFPRVYAEDPGDCLDCTQSFADFCDADGDGQVDPDRAGVGVTLCHDGMPCTAEGGGTPAACECPCSGDPVDEALLPECEDGLACATPTCGEGEADQPSCDFEEKPRLCQRYTRTNNDFDENACNMLSDEAGRRMAFRTATLDVDLSLDASGCGCTHQVIEEPAPRPRWDWPRRRCLPLLDRIFPRRCRPPTCTRVAHECDESENLKLAVKISVSDSPWGTGLLDDVRFFDCTPSEEDTGASACPNAPPGTIDISSAGGPGEGGAVGSCSGGECSIDLDGISCGEGTHSRRLCLLHQDVAFPPEGSPHGEPLGFGTPTLGFLDVDFSIGSRGCELEVTEFSADLHEYALGKALDPEGPDTNPCLTLFAEEVPGITVCEHRADGPYLHHTLDHLIRIQQNRQDGGQACSFPDLPEEGFPPRSPKGFWTPPPLTEQEKACADWMWQKRFEASERCQSDPGCAERFCWCGYNASAPDGKCDPVVGQEAMQREFLEDFCGRCHQHGDDSEGGFNIDDVTYPADPNEWPWDAIIERLQSQDPDTRMPPPDAYVPDEDLQIFLDSLTGAGPQCSARGEACDASSPCCDTLDNCQLGVCAPGCKLKSDPMCADEESGPSGEGE